MGKFVSLTKPIVLCTIGKRILCWSIFATEPIADFCPLMGYWPLKNGSRDHNVKRNSLLLAKLIVFGTIGKKFHLDYFCQRKVIDFLLNLQYYKTTLFNPDNFTLQWFLLADFKFLNFTWDLKVGVPMIGNSYQELFLKICFLQLQLKSLKNSCKRVHFIIMLPAAGL